MLTKKQRKKVKKTEIDEVTGLPVRAFTQLDTSSNGITVTTPSAIKKRCAAAVKRAEKMNAAKAKKKKSAKK